MSAVLGLGITSISAQNVFVLGGPGTTPMPPIVYASPVVMGAPTVIYQPVAVPVCPVYTTLVYPTTSCYSGYDNYNPNVIYVGGPGPAYYDYPPCSTPNVIYFGRTQAYREGYNFGHRR